MVGIDAYKKVQIQTASSPMLLLQSYDYIINNLYKMIQPNAEENDPKYCVYKANAMEKLLALHSCVDFSQEGELPKMLGDLYGWSLKHLTDGKPALDVISVMSELKEGFSTPV